MRNEKYDIFSVKCVLEHLPTGGIYVVRRNPNDTNRGGKLDFPGGQIEDHEDPISAAYREFTEEVAPVPADVIVHDMVRDVRPSSYGGWNVRYFLFASTESQVQFAPTSPEPECVEGYFVRSDFAKVALGHQVQRLAVAHKLPMQRERQVQLAS